jgi:hypothetical protein
MSNRIRVAISKKAEDHAWSCGVSLETVKSAVEEIVKSGKYTKSGKRRGSTIYRGSKWLKKKYFTFYFWITRENSLITAYVIGIHRTTSKKAGKTKK